MCNLSNAKHFFPKLDLVGGEEEGDKSNLQMQLNCFESPDKLHIELHYWQRGGAGGLGNEFSLF